MTLREYLESMDSRETIKLYVCGTYICTFIPGMNYEDMVIEKFLDYSVYYMRTDYFKTSEDSVRTVTIVKVTYVEKEEEPVKEIDYYCGGRCPDEVQVLDVELGGLTRGDWVECILMINGFAEFKFRGIYYGGKGNAYWILDETEDAPRKLIGTEWNIHRTGERANIFNA